MKKIELIVLNLVFYKLDFIYSHIYYLIGFRELTMLLPSVVVSRWSARSVNI